MAQQKHPFPRSNAYRCLMKYVNNHQSLIRTMIQKFFDQFNYTIHCLPTQLKSSRHLSQRTICIGYTIYPTPKASTTSTNVSCFFCITRHSICCRNNCMIQSDLMQQARRLLLSSETPLHEWHHHYIIPYPM